LTTIDLTPGQGLGDRFLLVRRIAESASSQVWLAENRDQSRRVALKIFDTRLLDAPGAEARLRAEVDAARALPPGRAATVYGLHRVDGLTLLEMEYLPGGDLGQFRGRSFTVFAPALLQVAETLAAAHERGFVHRDLKCANVLLDADGRARLADFGLATLAGVTATGGSPYNMSPQQIRGEPATPADDLYAFGAMLYELLAGYPPFYPDITRDRVLHEPVPALVPRAAAPERARQLTLRLLAKSAQGRPASMDEVRHELLLAQQEPTEQGTTGRGVATTAEERPGPVRLAPQETSRRWAGIAGALLLAAVAVAVFMWLPDYVAGRSASTGDQAAAAERARAEQLKEAQQGAQVLAEARAAAEQARDRFVSLLSATEERAAAVWATAALATVREQAGEASRRFDLGEFAAAREQWEAAIGGLGAIDSGRAAALAQALAAGGQALRDGRSEAAAGAFRLALEIEPGDATAVRGLARANKLDEVLALLDQAGRDEQQGRISDARQAYRKALALDDEAPGAREALDRIARQQANEAFAGVMSRGLAAMAGGRTADAREAFRQAESMRPGSGEVQQALAELERIAQAEGLQALSERARSAERAERWEEARLAWSEALEREPTLEPARAGLDRVVPRVALDARIDGLIGTPERLWTQAGRTEAESVIAAAADAPAPKASLVGRVAELRALLQAAQTPVRVMLESDGVTDVVIYRVGRMGSFERREVELMPGRYAVVGTRPGYRDVREDVVIRPGELPGPVAVRCKEPI